MNTKCSLTLFYVLMEIKQANKMHTRRDKTISYPLLWVRIFSLSEVGGFAMDPEQKLISTASPSIEPRI